MDINNTLKLLQDKEYEALEQISTICELNSIFFFLRGGSVLGAVKYNDFVPWDDDIDIALPRTDYEKLIEIMPNYFGNGLEFVSYQKTKDAHCYFPRIILTKEYCKKMNLPENNERGLVLIDVLPLDGMPNNNLLRKFHICKSYFYRMLASLWTLNVKDTVSMHDGKSRKVLKMIHAIGIHRFYKQDTVYHHLDKMYAKYPFGRTNYSGMMASSKLEKEIVPSEWWGKGEKMKFRDLEVNVPSNYDGYLKQLFGDDYADFEPPMKERRKSHLRGNI